MLDEYGWNDSIAARFGQISTPETYPGRVVRVDRGQFQAATEEGVVACFASTNLSRGGIAVGDWAAVTGDARLGRTIVAIIDRTSAIVRRDPSPGDHRDQVLAANLDSAFVVYRLDRKLKMAVLERYMVLIWDSGAVPVIVLSKADLVSPQVSEEAIREVSQSTPGVTVVALSGLTGAGVDELATFIAPGMSVGLVGESGVGKSTLVNRLVGENMLATAPARRSDGKGRHTTSARELVPLGNGAVLIDTPGLRSVGLSDSHQGIGAVFEDVEELITMCRFRDCAHDSEPGCAVQSAIEHRVLERRRFESYQKLKREQERLKLRKAAIARRAERKQTARRRLRVRRTIDDTDSGE